MERISPHVVPNPHRLVTPKQPTHHRGASFDRLLQKEIGESSELKVSKHARERLDERNISIDSGQWQNIQGRMAEAREKGITDSLVVTKNAALVVSTQNNTVVTAMDRKEANTHVFTNINGTILMD